MCVCVCVCVCLCVRVRWEQSRVELGGTARICCSVLCFVLCCVVSYDAGGKNEASQGV